MHYVVSLLLSVLILYRRIYIRVYVGAIKEKHVPQERERGGRVGRREGDPLFIIYNLVADYRSRIITLFLSCTDYSGIQQRALERIVGNLIR